MTDFRAGQVWSYATREGEENSRIIICKVESHAALGTIVHIHVDGVAMKRRDAPEGVNRVISHMPFSEGVLRESVMDLESTRQPLPEFEEGYQLWKEAFDDGNAGVFTVSVAEAVDVCEQAFNKAN